MSNDVTMTITGNVVDQPRMRRIKNGTVVTNFRVASTSRRYDRELNRYVDNTTLFVTVSAWRTLGENVARSLSKGQPVIVTGRYFQKNYVVDEQPRTSYELEANAVGHDLTRGVSAFSKVSQTASPTVAVDAAGVPSDDSEHYRDAEPVVDGAGPADLVFASQLGREEAEDDSAYNLGDDATAAVEEYVADPSARGLVFAS